MCEPIAFHGEVSGIGALNREVLRLRTGEGLTGWVAEHNETIRLGDAGADPRGLQLGTDHVRGVDAAGADVVRVARARA